MREVAEPLKESRKRAEGKECMKEEGWVRGGIRRAA
jgi:hypothetical protein